MLRACQVLVDPSNDTASWQNPIAGASLTVAGDASIDGNLTVTGDIFADDITYDVNTCNIFNINTEIRHLNNDTNRIAFDTDKMTIDASGTSIVLDDTAMNDKIVITGQTRFDDLAKFEDITIQNNITHDGDADTKIVFLNNQISIETGGISAVNAATSGTIISPQLTIANPTGQPKLLAIMGGVNEENRFAIQNAQINGNTRFYVLPNGTGSISATNYSNVSDLTATEQRRADIGMVANEFRCSTSNIGAGPIASKTPFTWRSESTEVMRMDGVGNLTVNSSTARTEPLSVNNRTGTTLRFAVKDNGQINLTPLASAPASAVAGDVYYDSALQKLRNNDGTNWYQLDNHFRSGTGTYPTDYDVLLVGDDATPSGGARTNVVDPNTAIAQQGIVLKARGQIQWNASTADGGPSCTIFRTTNSAELVLAYGWRNSNVDGTNWQSSQTSNALQRSAVQLANGAVKFYVNPAQAGTAGSATGVTPQLKMNLDANFLTMNGNRGFIYPNSGTAGAGVGVYNTGIACESRMIYELIFSANPNNGGSGEYRAVFEGRITISTGWNGSATTSYIDYTPLVAAQAQNVSNLTIVTRFRSSGGATFTNVPSTTVGQYTLQIQVSGYNTSWVNAAEELYLARKL